jgi:hypothetical protein
MSCSKKERAMESDWRKDKINSASHKCVSAINCPICVGIVPVN